MKKLSVFALAAALMAPTAMFPEHPVNKSRTQAYTVRFFITYIFFNLFFLFIYTVPF